MKMDVILKIYKEVKKKTSAKKAKNLKFKIYQN